MIQMAIQQTLSFLRGTEWSIWHCVYIFIPPSIDRDCRESTSENRPSIDRDCHESTSESRPSTYRDCRESTRKLKSFIYR